MTQLTPLMQKFILHWGEMGSTWGLNRATAQIIALLYISPEPLTAEEICETLSIARSTVSAGLHELQNWGIVKVTHVLGDRRDHFVTMSDVGELYRTIAKERKSREIDPLLSMLRENIAAPTNQAAPENTEYQAADPHVQERLQAMFNLLNIIDILYKKTEAIPTETLLKLGKQLEQMPTETLLKLVRLGDKLGDMLTLLAKG